MKVGVYSGAHLPEHGGGYTFQREVVHSLLRLASDTQHKFVIFSWNKEPSHELIIHPDIHHVSLQRNFKTRLLNKIGNSLMPLLKPTSGYHLNNVRTKNGFERFIIQSILTHGVALMWSLTPECLTLHIPFIITVWDLEHRKQPYFPECNLQGEWEGRERNYQTFLKRASFIITGTEEGKREIERFYQVPSERIKALPFPSPHFFVDAPHGGSEQVLTTYKLPPQFLFYPAQFWPHKNHANLLQAIRILKEQYGILLPMVLVGSDKGNESYIKQLVIQLGLSEQIFFPGFVPQSDLVSLYRNAFALTFVSFFGPDNVPPLEAFVLGCPVIAARVPGAEEQLGDAALLVDPASPQEIASVIKSLWEDKDQGRTLVARGFTRASRWTGDDYVNGIFSILDQFEAIRCCWGD